MNEWMNEWMNEDLQRYLEVARRATSTYEWVLTLVIYLFHTQCVMLRANGHYRACGKGMHATVIKYTLAVASRTSAVQTVQIMSHVYSLCLYSYQEMFQLNSPKKKNSFLHTTQYLRHNSINSYPQQNLSRLWICLFLRPSFLQTFPSWGTSNYRATVEPARHENLWPHKEPTGSNMTTLFIIDSSKRKKNPKRLSTSHYFEPNTIKPATFKSPSRCQIN